MLHIKDIEAFAHINEALAEREEAEGPGPGGLPGGDDHHNPALHPALLLALAARAQNIPYREDDSATDPAPDTRPTEPPTSLASVIARLLFPR